MAHSDARRLAGHLDSGRPGRRMARTIVAATGSDRVASTLDSQPMARPHRPHRRDRPKQQVGRFIELTRPHHAPLQRIARALCHDRDIAADLTQETLIKAFRAFDRIDTSKPMLPWLARILRNVYLDTLKTSRARHEIAAHERAETADDPYAQIAHPTADPLAELERTELRHWLREEVDALDPDQRLVIILCDIEEFGYEDAAQVAGVPIGTVRSRLSRARARLRARLIERMSSPPDSTEGGEPFPHGGRASSKGAADSTAAKKQGGHTMKRKISWLLIPAALLGWLVVGCGGEELDSGSLTQNSEEKAKAQVKNGDQDQVQDQVRAQVKTQARSGECTGEQHQAQEQNEYGESGQHQAQEQNKFGEGEGECEGQQKQAGPGEGQGEGEQAQEQNASGGGASNQEQNQSGDGCAEGEGPCDCEPKMDKNQEQSQEGCCCAAPYGA